MGKDKLDQFSRGDTPNYDQLLSDDREAARAQLGPNATRIEVDLKAEALFAKRHRVIPEVGPLATKNSPKK